MLNRLQERSQYQLTTGGHAVRQWGFSVGLATAVGIAYFLAARLSLALLAPDGVAVFWPSAGIALGILVALGKTARLPVVAGITGATIAANLLGDRNLATAVIFALCNSGETLLTALLIERYLGKDFDLDKFRNVLGFVAAAAIGSAASGVGGAIGFQLFYGSKTSSLITWQDWFASDALGIITVAPLLIGLLSNVRPPPLRNELTEGTLALLVVAVMSVIVISLPPGFWQTVVPIALLFPLLLWLAARCRPVFAAAAAFIVTVAIVWTTTFGIGHFGDAALPIAERVLSAQAGIMVVAICALVLAALFAERRQFEDVLTERETGLQEALRAGAVTTFEWNTRTGLSLRSDNAVQILGLNQQEMFSANSFLTHVHPEDRARYKSIVNAVDPRNPSYAVSFRFKRPSDGRVIWLEETSRADFDSAGSLVRIKGLTFDVTERKQAEERQAQLVAELDHRVKNALASISAIAAGTQQRSISIDEYTQALDMRIHSMAIAHSLLSQKHWHGVELTNLVQSQLAPYASGANIKLAGPSVTLTATAIQAVAMVLHELVTNAAKYGALSTREGRVSVTWTRRRIGDAAGLTITWHENGGPPVIAPNQPGYGTSLIRELIPHELGGDVTLTFASDGVYCKMEIPSQAIER